MPLPSSLTRSRNSSLVVTDLDLDAPGPRVPKRVPQGFRRDLVDLVANDRVEFSRLALDNDVEVESRVVTRVVREFVANRSNRLCQIVPFEG